MRFQTLPALSGGCPKVPPLPLIASKNAPGWRVYADGWLNAQEDPFPIQEAYEHKSGLTESLAEVILAGLERSVKALGGLGENKRERA